jgi:predicted MFS family arabinose efflux permease
LSPQAKRLVRRDLAHSLGKTIGVIKRVVHGERGPNRCLDTVATQDRQGTMMTGTHSNALLVERLADGGRVFSFENEGHHAAPPHSPPTPVLGPSVGGFITTYASWHWIFLLNVPFGVVAFICARALIPQQRDAARHPLDIPGFVLSGAALTSLLYGTELASRTGASLSSVLGFLLTSLVLGFAAIRYAQVAQHPLLNFATLRVPTFSVTVLSGSATRIGRDSVPYLLPLLFQIGFGLSAFRSGLLMLFGAAGNLCMKMFTTRILARFGFRSVAIWTCAAGAAAVMAFGWLKPSTPLLVILGATLAYGLARSLQFSTLATLAHADVPDELRSAASTLWSVAQQTTIGMGIAFGALSLRLAGLIRDGAPDTPIMLSDFSWAFAAASVMIAASILGYAGLARDAGSRIGGGSGSNVRVPTSLR